MRFYWHLFTPECEDLRISFDKIFLKKIELLDIQNSHQQSLQFQLVSFSLVQVVSPRCFSSPLLSSPLADGVAEAVAPRGLRGGRVEGPGGAPRGDPDQAAASLAVGAQRGRTFVVIFGKQV